MSFNRVSKLALIAGLVAASAFGAPPVAVLPVPWDPTNLTSPHTVITAQQAILTATVNLGTLYGVDNFTYSWNFGDASPATAAQPVQINCRPTTLGCFLNLSATHTYTAAAGTAYTAVLTVTDTSAGNTTYTGNYYVIVQSNVLSSRVNVAIDNGLWYLHTTMERGTTTDINSITVNYGGWDNGIQGQTGYAAQGFPANDATNILAFESSGHLETGPTADPYTDDVSRGLARLMQFLGVVNNLNDNGNSANYAGGVKTVNYNPAVYNARCSDGSEPNYTAQTCSSGTYIAFSPGATSCTTPPCSFTYDGNNNGQMLFVNSQDPGYQNGIVVTAIVGSGNTAGIAKLGSGPGGAGSCPTTGNPNNACPGVVGQTYGNIVQDMIDNIGYCQVYFDTTGSDGSGGNGGGWEYVCAGTVSYYYDDNSPSQWNAIGMIAANRGFGLTIPQIVKDTNQVWVTWSENFSTSGAPRGGYAPQADGVSGQGSFGYSEWGYEPWGPWAVTPSGMVQMAMDGVGRTAATASDQRWNMAETNYHDNFCNNYGDAHYDPKRYTYGLFSFTKAMEQHDPGGVLTPITNLSQEPSGAQPYDWYNMQMSLGAPCDGVAQTLVSRNDPYGQNTALGSYWYGNDAPDTGQQQPFETAWTVIMLQKTSFIACVNNLAGQGKAGSGRGKPLVSLSWSPIGAASSYSVLRSTSAGGPFSQVGTSTVPAFNDQTAGLANLTTFYYELQPLNSNGGAICTSNIATIAIP